MAEGSELDIAPAPPGEPDAGAVAQLREHAQFLLRPKHEHIAQLKKQHPQPNDAGLSQKEKEENARQYEADIQQRYNKPLVEAAEFIYMHPALLAMSGSPNNEVRDLLTAAAVAKPELIYQSCSSKGPYPLMTGIADEYVWETITSALQTPVEKDIKAIKRHIVQNVVESEAHNRPGFYLLHMHKFDIYFGHEKEKDPVHPDDIQKAFVGYMERFHQQAVKPHEQEKEKSGWWVKAVEIYDGKKQTVDSYLESIGRGNADKMTSATREHLLHSMAKYNQLQRIYQGDHEAMRGSYAALDNHTRTAVIGCCNGIALQKGKALAIGGNEWLLHDTKKQWMGAFKGHPFAQSLAELARQEGSALCSQWFLDYNGPAKTVQQILRNAAEANPKTALVHADQWTPAFKDEPQLVQEMLAPAIAGYPLAANRHMDKWLPHFKQNPEKLMELLHTVETHADNAPSYRVLQQVLQRYSKEQMKLKILREINQHPDDYPELHKRADDISQAAVEQAPKIPYTMLAERREVPFSVEKTAEMPIGPGMSPMVKAAGTSAKIAAL